MSDFTTEQQRLDELVDLCRAEAADAFETNEGFLFDAVMRAESLDDAGWRLLECYPKLSADVLADILHRGMVAAECWGRLTVQNEVAEADTAEFADSDATEIKLEPLPMREAVEFWDSKLHLGESEFKRLNERYKLRAFSVAGKAKGDELTEIYQALRKALTKGTTLAEFQDDVRKHFGGEWDGASGRWVGGDAWHMEVVFRTNMQTAYNIGRFKQQKEVAKYYPYLRYSAVIDPHTRPTHAQLHGKIYPIDHRFWDTWYPPNGYMCRCSTDSVSKGEVSRQNLKVETAMPAGITPEPGFAHHPGKVAWGGVLKEGEQSGDFRDMTLDGKPLKRASRDGSKPTPLQNVRVKGAGLRTLEKDELLEDMSDQEYLNAFNGAYLNKQIGEYKQVEDKLGDKVLLSPRVIQEDKSQPISAANVKSGKEDHGAFIHLLEEMITDPYEIWLVPQENDAGKVRLVKRYVKLWEDEDGTRIAALAMYEVVDGILQGVTMFAPGAGYSLGYVDRMRVGLRLYRMGEMKK